MAEEISAAARDVAAVISPLLAARLHAIYGPNWLDVVNARRAAAGAAPGPGLHDDGFCLAVFGHDPGTQGWADERWRGFARELNALASHAVATAEHSARAADIAVLFGTHFAPPASPAQPVPQLAPQPVPQPVPVGVGGDLAAAEVAILDRIGADPADPAPLIDLGKLYLDARRYEDVLAVSDRWRQRHPGDWRPDAWTALAYEELGRWSEAAAAYRRCTGFAPDHVDLWRGLWLCAGKSGDGATELAAAQQWADLAPADPHALACYALTLLGHGKPDEALDVAERALAIDPDHRLAHLARADTLARLQRWPDAVGAYRRCVRLDPASAGAWKKLWTASVHAGDRAAGREATAGWTAAAPDDALAWQCHTRELMLTGRYHDAIDAAQRCLALDADNEQVRKDYGAALYLTDDLDRLAAFAQRWPDPDPDLPAMLLKARALRDLGHYREAADLAARVNQLDDSVAAAWEIRAYSLGRAGEPEPAVEAAERWLALAPVQARSGYAAALYDARRWHRVVEFIDREWPGSERSPDALTLKAKALQALGRHADAVHVAERAAQTGPLGRVPSGVWEVQAWSLAELGHVDGAAAAARRLLQIDAQNPYFWFLLTRAFIEGRRWEEAVDAAEGWVWAAPGSAEAVDTLDWLRTTTARWNTDNQPI